MLHFFNCMCDVCCFCTVTVTLCPAHLFLGIYQSSEFIRLFLFKVREAEEKAGLGAESVANLQDLEAEESPETMMISVLTGDLSDTGRADRYCILLV